MSGGIFKNIYISHYINSISNHALSIFMSEKSVLQWKKCAKSEVEPAIAVINLNIHFLSNFISL